jgi:cation transport regulator ChaB
MPYKTNADLPEQCKTLPAGAKTIWRKSFNSAFEGSCDQDDSCAAQVAWSAVKKGYMKKDEMWVKKDMKNKKEFIAQMETTLSGSFPEVAMKPGVNIEELIKNDPDPTYVSLPIAQVGAVTDDGFTYTSEFVTRLHSAVMDETITGHMGHIPSYERDTKFPVPDVFWLGSMLDSHGKLWAKGYVSNKDVAHFVRQLKATNGVIATSVYGTYPSEMAMVVDTRGNSGWSIRADAFDVEHIDFAPPKRAALDIPGRTMQVTNHMKGKGKKNMNKHEFLAQLKPEDLPTTLLEQLSKPKDELISQLKAQVEDSVKALAEIKTQMEAMAQELFTKRVERLVQIAVKVDDSSLRDFVSTKVFTHTKPTASAEELDKAVKDVVESESYTKLAQGVLMNLTGGKPITSAPVNGDEQKSAAEEIEGNMEAILNKFGVKV